MSAMALVIRPVAGEDWNGWKKLWDGYLAFYREHAASQTATGHGANALAGVYCWDRILNDGPLASWSSELKARLAAAEFRLATELLRDGDNRAARSHARRAVALDRSLRAAALATAAYVAPRLAKRAIARRRRTPPVRDATDPAGPQS